MATALRSTLTDGASPSTSTADSAATLATTTLSNRFARRFGLRRQIIGAFALGAFLLSVLLSLTAYTLTRSSLLDRQEVTASARVGANAETIERGLEAGTALNDLVASLNRPEGVQPLLIVDNVAFAPSAFSFGEADLHGDLRRKTIDLNRPMKMRYRRSQLDTPALIEGAEDDVVLVIGLPLNPDEEPRTRNAQYFEATSLADVEATLRSLALVLLAATAFTALTGVLLGFYVAQRLLRPLRTISTAAELIAGGELSTRLNEESDRDLQALTHSFNDMASTLEDRIQRDARFASDVSHELRSPLMTLTASSQILENRRNELPEAAKVAVGHLSTDIARFKQLVEDLLEISRFDVGAAGLAHSPLPVGEFVRQAVAFAGADELPIEVTPGAASLYAEIDKRRMGQVIRNLIENAEKYANGATRVLVERRTDFQWEGLDRELAVIIVEDAGPGIPDDEKEQIFERFFRGAEGGRRGSGTGVGLGLALVREHVRLHDGTIRVEDRPDGASGSRFVVELPVTEVDEAELW